MVLLHPVSNDTGIFVFISAVFIVIGWLICFWGHRLLSKIFAFFAGGIAGWCLILWMFSSQMDILDVPEILGALGACVGAVVAVLIHSVSLGAVTGYILSALIIILDNNYWFQLFNRRIILYVCFSIFFALIGLCKPNHMIYYGNGLGGAFMVILGLDHYAGKKLTSMIFNGGVLESALGVDIVYPTCTISCYILLGVWLSLVIMGCSVQFILSEMTSQGLFELFRSDQNSSKLDGKEDIISRKVNEAYRDISLAKPSGKASYNYFIAKDLPEPIHTHYRNLCSIFDALEAKFGFQRDSKLNQTEHLLFLIWNSKGLPITDWIIQLHEKIFSNYHTWCEFLNTTPNISNKGNNVNTHDKLQEIALWLCIWGEASNIRHMPECCWFIFHSMAFEIKNQKSTPNSEFPMQKNKFLIEVITPIYNVVSSVKGDIGKKLHYDDFNEFFWDPKCLDLICPGSCYFSSSDYGMPDIECNPVAKALKSASKTWLEKRSWVHPIRSFFRILTFHAVLFHLLVAISFLSYSNFNILGLYSNKVLSGVVVTLSFFSICKELLGIWATFGIITDNLRHALGMIFRLCVKCLFFITLSTFYYWSFTRNNTFWHVYLFVCIGYLTPQLFYFLGQSFPTLLSFKICPAFVTSVIHFWWPISTLYVGRNIQVQELVTHKYQLFWISLFCWKTFCSYHFQIKPLVEPTMELLNNNQAFLKTDQNWPGLSYFLIILTWLPFIVVFLFDASIWYALWQAIVGWIEGVGNKLGDITNFSSLSGVFPMVAQRFADKMLNTTNKNCESPPPRLSSFIRDKREVIRAEYSDSSEHGCRVVNQPQRHGPVSESIHRIRQRDRYGITRPPRDHYGIPRPPSGNLRSGFVSEYPERGSASTGEITFDGRSSISSTESERSRSEDSEYESTKILNTLNSGVGVCVKQIGDSNKAFNNDAWEKFSIIWNAIVDDIRTSDLITAMEYHYLIFRRAHDSQRKAIPLFLTAGVIHNAIEKCANIARKWQKSDLVSQKKATREIANYFSDPIKREAFTEVWQIMKWIMSNLFGKAYYHELDIISNVMYSFLANNRLLETIDMRILSRILPAILKFVRGLRLASLQKKKEDEKKRKVYADNLSENEKFSEDDTKSKFTSSTSQGKNRRRRSKNVHKVPRLKSSAMNRTFSSKTLHMVDMIRGTPRYSAQMIKMGDNIISNLHANLLRDQLRELLIVVISLFKVTDPESKECVDILQKILTDKDGFFWHDIEAAQNIHRVLNHHQIDETLQTLYCFLALAEVDAVPMSIEANRRLLFFINSIFMNLPTASSVRDMLSWSILTPFYSEKVLYSVGDLKKQTKDGLSLFLYLQTIYPQRWKNFLERIKVKHHQESSLLESKEKSKQVQQWASRCGQTLGRTVDGMMLYRKALILLASLEEPALTEPQLEALATRKFQYVVAAQVYGKHKREGDIRSKNIDSLLSKYPSLRIAYIDVCRTRGHDNNDIKQQYSSVLIKNGEHGIQSVYQIKLPGNPILGEGKPENQNHAVIFTRGEILQAIDMNQEGYLEEALKMRNLLEEFKEKKGKKPVAIVGFREHIFTGSLSNLANYMALQESTFVTLGQRVLYSPLRMRLHYGHPDLFDKLFFMGRGGISKAGKGVNLSEDIFAGFTAVLRGGEVMFREYLQVGKGRDVGLQQLFKFEAKLAQGAAMQCLTRDVFRLCFGLDFFRLLSFFYGGLGFYICNCLTIWALYFFLYARLFLAAFHFQDVNSFPGLSSISFWFGQIGFLLTLPIFAAVAGERGFRAAFWEVLRMVSSGGPLFFVFHMGTKAHFFSTTLLAGQAKYRPTGRGFVTKHEGFAELYRFHATSHFYKGSEMVLLLLLYIHFSTSITKYLTITWAGWFIAISWLFAPFWFNPMAFVWDKVTEDLHRFRIWMRRNEGDGQRSWKMWRREEIAYLSLVDPFRKSLLCLSAFRHAIVGISLLSYQDASLNEILSMSAILLILIFFAYLKIAKLNPSYNQTFVRSGRLLASFFGTGIIFALIYYYHSSTVAGTLIILVALVYFLMTAVSIPLFVGIELEFIVWVDKLCDYAIGLSILGILGILSLVDIPSRIQTRLMFHNAFSRGILINQLLRGRKNAEQSEQPQPKQPKQPKQLILSRNSSMASIVSLDQNSNVEEKEENHEINVRDNMDNNNRDERNLTGAVARKTSDPSPP